MVNTWFGTIAGKCFQQNSFKIVSYDKNAQGDIAIKILWWLNEWFSFYHGNKPILVNLCHSRDLGSRYGNVIQYILQTFTVFLPNIYWNKVIPDRDVFCFLLVNLSVRGIVWSVNIAVCRYSVIGDQHLRKSLRWRLIDYESHRWNQSVRSKNKHSYAWSWRLGCTVNNTYVMICTSRVLRYYPAMMHIQITLHSCSHLNKFYTNFS